MKKKHWTKVWAKGYHPRKKGPGIRHAQGARPQKWPTVADTAESLAISTKRGAPDVIRRSKFKRPGVLRKAAR